ncbi:MAG: cytochrome C [Betaproteobacteria bacterium]|nr:cytochrome C [Betaproteobacteria bacterium]
MSAPRLAAWVIAGVIFLAGAPVAGQAQTTATEAANGKAAEPAPPKFPNEACLGCHGNEGFGMPGADGKMRSLHVTKEKFEKSVHGKRQCVECHQDITEIPHEKGVRRKVSCVSCHEALWVTARKEHKTQEFARLGVVVDQIERYMKSVHARPSKADQSYTNATCYDCHDAHYVYPKGSPARTQWRLSIPNACGKCHGKERAEYATSVHGDEVLWKANPKAAICSDCHTTHDVANPELPTTRLVITKNCGTCHQENLKTYLHTYHGQVSTLGYAYTAKCFDCHGNHGIQRVSDPASTVHPDKRLNTCQKCHANATAGFVSFQPHANTRDFDRYPYMWIATKFMIALLAGVFAFFWLHSALWFYREYRDRREGKSRPHVVTEALLPQLQGKYYRRFRLGWRVAHLALILSVMLLVLTGMSVFYADTDWAKAIMHALGGPRVAGTIHRIAAATFATLFFGHLIYLSFRLGRNWKISDWFGSNSLVPRWQDFTDAFAMFRWFFGRGPRPVFDRWTYWEKFDYWAVFGGMTIIGSSGLMLWFPGATASVLPGWVFNVATLIHGEEAFLAAVFLFTVHFFNNHFRPDKYPPPDIVMFTGAVSLEEFKREHTLEYQRLVETGQIEKYLVDAPSRPMTLGSRILGLTLIAIGLTLLVLVLAGFIGT